MNARERAPAHFAALADSAAFSKITMETEYGLIIERGPGNSIVAKLRDDVVVSQPEPDKLGYLYRLSTDYGTEHLFYDITWPGNPEGPNVWEDNIIKENGGFTQDAALRAWIAAWLKWADTYDEGFRKHVEEKGDFSQDPFPEVKEREAWGIQGMLLAVWLSLLLTVKAVKYTPGGRTAVCDRTAGGPDSIGSTMARHLKDMNALINGD